MKGGYGAYRMVPAEVPLNVERQIASILLLLRDTGRIVCHVLVLILVHIIDLFHSMCLPCPGDSCSDLSTLHLVVTRHPSSNVPPLQRINTKTYTLGSYTLGHISIVCMLDHLLDGQPTLMIFGSQTRKMDDDRCLNCLNLRKMRT
jgi:hypothetical protein